MTCIIVGAGPPTWSSPAVQSMNKEAIESCLFGSHSGSVAKATPTFVPTPPVFLRLHPRLLGGLDMQTHV